MLRCHLVVEEQEEIIISGRGVLDFSRVQGFPGGLSNKHLKILVWSLRESCKLVTAEVATVISVGSRCLEKKNL